MKGDNVMQNQNIKNIISEISNFENAKNNIFIGAARKGTNREEFVYATLYDVEMFFYLRIPSVSDVIKIGIADMLKMWDISEEELLNIAAVNTERETVITSLGSLISEMSGEDFEDIPSQLVITNKSALNGAGAFFMNTILDKACEMLRVDTILVIPSSVHELLVMPENELEREYMDETVKEINESTVSEKDQLADHTFLYHKGTGFIS